MPCLLSFFKSGTWILFQGVASTQNGDRATTRSHQHNGNLTNASVMTRAVLHLHLHLLKHVCRLVCSLCRLDCKS